MVTNMVTIFLFLSFIVFFLSFFSGLKNGTEFWLANTSNTTSHGRPLFAMNLTFED